MAKKAKEKSEPVSRDQRVTDLATMLKKYKDLEADAIQKKHPEAQPIQLQRKYAIQQFEALKQYARNPEDCNDSEFDRIEGNILSVYEQSKALVGK